MEEWGILDKILFSDSRVEGEEKKKKKNQDLNQSYSKHFLLIMKWGKFH